MYEIGYIVFGIGMLTIFGVKLELLTYGMRLVFDVCPSNQTQVAGHLVVKPVVDVIFLKIILNGRKCRRLVLHVS